jgi:hypothetical protein
MLYFVFLFIILIILIILIFFINKNTSNKIKKCKSKTVYIEVDINKMKEKQNTFERKTTKMVAKNNSKYKLLQEPNFLIPSMMNGTYCDINYSTYYIIPKNINIINDINDNIKIRIRYYYFSPGLFFEIKIKEKNIKIRTEIDYNYNIINKDSVSSDYYPLLERILEMLKKDKLEFLCTTKYKRFSYFYFNDNNIRITLDTDIEYNKKKIPELNILEIKYPIDYINSEVVTEIINKCSSFNFKVSKISKSKISSYDKFS